MSYCVRHVVGEEDRTRRHPRDTTLASNIGVFVLFVGGELSEIYLTPPLTRVASLFDQLGIQSQYEVITLLLLVKGVNQRDTSDQPTRSPPRVKCITTPTTNENI